MKTVETELDAPLMHPTLNTSQTHQNLDGVESYVDMVVRITVISLPIIKLVMWWIPRLTS